MRNRLQLFFGFLLIIGIVTWVGYFSQGRAETKDKLRVYFLNVGQGDAEYIKLPTGQDILIDGGPDNSVLAELGKIMDLGDRRIDLVILTHPHVDHLTGLIDVINRFEIGEVWETGVEYPSTAYDTWRNLIVTKNIPDTFVEKGTSKIFGEAKFLIITPLSSLKNKTIDNLNNASIISELEYNKFSVLFLADAEISAQAQILSVVKPVTVVKIAHHGSANALNEDLARIARPNITVIEVGAKNTYGHPAASTIAFLKSIAAQIYRTDQNGTIQISSDGNSWAVK